MSDLDLRDDLVERLQDLARRENRPIDEVLETMLAQYHPHPEPEADDVDVEERLHALRRKLYEIARRYWREQGNIERLALSDEDLDEQFWLIDHEGIPRLKAEQGTIDLPPYPLEAIFGVFDDDVTDMSTSVRETMTEYWRRKSERTD